MRRARLRNGTRIAISGNYTVVALPDGKIVRGRPQQNAEQMQTAHDLGYGNDVNAMVADHDPLHALLCDFLGLSTSFSLSGGNETIARSEEAAVLAVQKFMKLSGGRLPI